MSICICDTDYKLGSVIGLCKEYYYSLVYMVGTGPVRCLPIVAIFLDPVVDGCTLRVILLTPCCTTSTPHMTTCYNNNIHWWWVFLLWQQQQQLRWLCHCQGCAVDPIPFCGWAVNVNVLASRVCSKEISTPRHDMEFPGYDTLTIRL